MGRLYQWDLIVGVRIVGVNHRELECELLLKAYIALGAIALIGWVLFYR